MDFSKVKLVASDMDGTLLNSKGELNNDFFPVFSKLKQKNILFIAASGRQIYNLINRFNKIKDDIVFIAENGAYVVYHGEEILIQSMNNDLTKRQIEKVRGINNSYIVLCGKKKAYIENDDPAFLMQVKKYYDRYEIVNDLMKVEDDKFLKVAVCDLEGIEKNRHLYFKNQDKGTQIKISGDIWLDISHESANKGKALEFIQKKFNITPEETMAFGDYMNDYELLRQAYFSYAVDNAYPEIKKTARFLTKSNDENGVLEILKLLIH